MHLSVYAACSSAGYYIAGAQCHLLSRQEDEGDDFGGALPGHIPSELGVDHTLPDGVIMQVRLRLFSGRYQVACSSSCRRPLLLPVIDAHYICVCVEHSMRITDCV